MSQVQELEDAVRPLLRPTEELKNVLQTLTDRIQEASGDDYSNSVSEALVKRRLLAVVSHRDEEEGYEQGCLLIYKFKSGLFLKGDLTVQQAFPINRTFSLAMAQTRHSTIDLRPSESHSALSQSRTEFSLSVTAGDGKEPLTLITHDIQGLKALLGECKRLKAEAEQREASTAPNTYSWVQYYTTKHVPVSLLSTIPPDLRIINRPLHTRLSPASAGLPGDDVADVELVREEWILRKAEELCSKDKHVQQTRLRLRIGTFNVNGKLPSQDLSPWVRGVSNSDSPLNTLPPLKPVSPLDLGEVSKNSEPVWPDESERQSTTSFEVQSVESDDESRTTVETTSSASTTVVTSVSTDSTTDRVNGERDSRRAEEASVEESETDPDLLVFGFQELDLSTEALLYSSKTSRVDAWTTAIFASLGEKGALYHKLASKQLVGMLLIVICKTRLKDSFRDVKVCAVGAGILGIMGNKGGTAIRVTYEPRASPEASPSRAITVTFVDAHLAAFDEMMERRNADFHDLSKRLVFDVVPLSSDASLVNNLPTTIYDSDVLFWMGDLNYRIDLSDSDIRTLLKSEPKDRNIESLLAFDQLRYSMRTGKSFQGFTEHEITRLPTYRFSAGLLADDLGYDMKRKPAWTDRILYMASPRTVVRQESYAGHRGITFSDHRPVSADFLLEVPLVDNVQFNAAVKTCYHKVGDMEESEQPPKVKLDQTLLDFGAVSYEKESTKVICLQNTGQRPCAYRFVPVESDGCIHPEWLKIEPMTGLLLPGEGSNISLTICIDKQSAPPLNMRHARLDCTLIMHTLFGKDHFITVHGDYQPTCFATTLSDLVRLPGPVRELNKADQLLPQTQAANAPREIMRLINWLMTHATDTRDLFLTAADEELVTSIRESLDTGSEFPFKPGTDGQYDRTIKIAFGETMVRFLDSLVEPVVPSQLHSKCLQVVDRDEAFEVLNEFPSESVNVWISFTAFLHFVCQQSDDKTEETSPTPPSKAHILASIFAPSLMRDDPSVYPPASPVGKQKFVLFFIS